jgi:GT2 family glycosyltransferase
MQHRTSPQAFARHGAGWADCATGYGSTDDANTVRRVDRGVTHSSPIFTSDQTILPSLAVGIVTKGRAAILRETLRELAGQTRQPAQILVCATSPDDLVGIEPGPTTRLIHDTAGTSSQRNRLLDELSGFDLVVFFDDDFLPVPRYLEVMADIFARWPDIVVATGRVLVDGAKGPGLSPGEAREIISRDLDSTDPYQISTALNGYGCNMAVRNAPICEHCVRFDERLPLYAWYEDIDFTRRLGRHGRIVRAEAARGVHLGVKMGRGSGVRLGYSQVANPIYLMRKGTYPYSHALSSIFRHLLANLAGSLRPEPYVDRRGRVRGNFRAFRDLLRGCITPERILDL